MASMTVVNCKWCKSEFQARTADVKRGWGKFCSKKCKAMEQEKKTGQNCKYLINSGSLNSSTKMNLEQRKLYEQERMHQEAMDGVECGWDAHKD